MFEHIPHRHNIEKAVKAGRRRPARADDDVDAKLLASDIRGPIGALVAHCLPAAVLCHPDEMRLAPKGV